MLGLTGKQAVGVTVVALLVVLAYERYHTGGKLLPRVSP